MIREIRKALISYEKDDAIRFIVFTSGSLNFSAGADLDWMKQGMQQSTEQLTAESKELASLFHDIYHSGKITISAITGKVMGGANGIVAASDFALAANDAIFSFPEVKLGLIPATITPFVVNKAGIQYTREWMLTGRKITASEAYLKGYITRTVEIQLLDRTLNDLIITLEKNGPSAMSGIKELLRDEDLLLSPDKMLDKTAKLIADFRISDEGQEGIHAFFEKRQPKWIDE